MNKEERKEEEKLINQIKEFKRLFRDSLKENIFKEREERHKKGEVFHEGFWVSRDKITEIQNAFLKRGRIVFFEIHFLVIILVLFSFFLWMAFKLFFLP